MVRRILTASLYAAGVFLYFIGAAPLVRWFGRKNPKILLYHDCSDFESDYVAGLECTTSPRNFARHLAYLAHHYRTLPLETLLSDNPPQRAVAITFDDGYRSVYDNAYPILRANRSPATVYLISSVVDNRKLAWVNELNYLVRRGGPGAVERVAQHFDLSPQATPAKVISVCRLNYDAAKIEVLLAELRQIVGRPPGEHALEAKLYLSWDQIHEMREGGVEFGNHSRTHPNMERLTDEEQRAEIEGAQKELEKHLPQVRAFAHPFGHRGPMTASIAAKVGLCSAADVGGHNCPVDALSLGRTHVANESVAGLFARMEVVEPVKAKLRQLMAGGKSQVRFTANRSALFAARR